MMLRFLLRAATVALVFVSVWALVAHAQDPSTVVLQPVQESGLSAKGSDLTWPTAAAVTAWRFIDVLSKCVDQASAVFTRWLDKTEGRIPISIRYTSQSVHTEVDPEPTVPVRVQTATYEGPDRRQRSRGPRVVEPEDHDDEHEPSDPGSRKGPSRS